MKRKQWAVDKNNRVYAGTLLNVQKLLEGVCMALSESSVKLWDNFGPTEFHRRKAAVQKFSYNE